MLLIRLTGKCSWAFLLWGRMFTIRDFKPKDVRKVSMLVADTFREYNLKDNTLEGSRKYIDFHENNNMEVVMARFNSSTHLQVAEEGNKLIGMLRATENRIVQLFIWKEYHRQGIGRGLFERYLEGCCEVGYKEIVLRAQLYAIPFYAALGFEPVGDVIEKDGLRVQEMRKGLN
jgi:predicted GNAT family N-acyltransferase